MKKANMNESGIEFSEQLRRAAAIIRNIWEGEYQRLHRKPPPHETILIAKAAAEGVLRSRDRAEGDPKSFPYRHLSSAWDIIRKRGLLPRPEATPGMTPEEPRPGIGDVYAPWIADAEAVIMAIARLGDRGSAAVARDAVDRKIVSLSVHYWAETGTTNNSAVARDLEKLGIKLSRITVADRLSARCHRIIGQLRNLFPDVWPAEPRLGRPRTRIWKPAEQRLPDGTDVRGLSVQALRDLLSDYSYAIKSQSDLRWLRFNARRPLPKDMSTSQKRGPAPFGCMAISDLQVARIDWIARSDDVATGDQIKALETSQRILKAELQRRRLARRDRRDDRLIARAVHRIAARA
jgi:hypothetical protein